MQYVITKIWNWFYSITLGNSPEGNAGKKDVFLSFDGTILTRQSVIQCDWLQSLINSIGRLLQHDLFSPVFLAPRVAPHGSAWIETRLVSFYVVPFFMGELLYGTTSLSADVVDRTYPVQTYWLQIR